MRLTNVYVSQYRRLSEANVAFAAMPSGSLLSDLYGKLNLTLMVGPNGAGKTSLLSFISQVFHNLQRYPERIPGAFELKYELSVPGHGIVECTLYRPNEDKGIFLRVAGVLDGEILRETTKGPPKQRKANELVYGDVRKFLPRTIIISVFSLHGEYPSERPRNFIGDEPVAIYDTANLYGANHYGFPPFSIGIRRLMSLVKDRAHGVSELEQLLGGNFTGRVATLERDDWGGWAVDDLEDHLERTQRFLPEWRDFSSEIAASESEEKLYLNDFEIMTPSGTLNLANMSSGQKMLFVRLLSLLSAIEDGALVIIEEPELHLDPSWTRQLITILLLFFRQFDAHFVVATHSFSLINALPRSCILHALDGQFSTPLKPTLLANESSLASSLFSASPHQVEQHLLASIHDATVEQLSALLEQMGDSAARVEVFKRLRELKGRS